MALVKLLIFIELVFTSIVQIYFQSFSQWFIPFKTYDTRCRYFFNIKVEQLQNKVLKQWHGLNKTDIFLKENFHCNLPNAFSYDLGPLIHDKSILIDYQPEAIAGHCFET